MSSLPVIVQIVLIVLVLFITAFAGFLLGRTSNQQTVEADISALRALTLDAQTDATTNRRLLERLLLALTDDDAPPTDTALGRLRGVLEAAVASRPRVSTTKRPTSATRFGSPQQRAVDASRRVEREPWVAADYDPTTGAHIPVLLDPALTDSGADRPADTSHHTPSHHTTSSTDGGASYDGGASSYSTPADSSPSYSSPSYDSGSSSSSSDSGSSGGGGGSD